MLGLFVLAVLIGVGFLIYLGYKVPRKYFNSKIAGFLGALLVFSIFFGDHIYKYAHFNFICMTQVGGSIYDQEAYERFKKNENKKPYFWGKELIDFKKQNPALFANIKEDVNSVIYDKKNHYLYFSYKKPKDNPSFLRSKILDLDDNHLIQEYITYYGGKGGWFFRIMDIDSGKANLGSCK